MEDTEIAAFDVIAASHHRQSFSQHLDARGVKKVESIRFVKGEEIEI